MGKDPEPLNAALDAVTVAHMAAKLRRFSSELHDLSNEE
jgi:hypothetical protein